MAHMRRGVRVLLLDTHAQYTNGRRHGGWDLGNVGGLPEGITVRSEAHRGGSHLELAMIGPVLSAERPPTCPRKDAEMLTKAAKFQRLADCFRVSREYSKPKIHTLNISHFRLPIPR
eukprot:5076787-Pyramimonas_sp.AAC.1